MLPYRRRFTARNSGSRVRVYFAFPSFRRSAMRRLVIVAATLLLAACGSSAPDGASRSPGNVVVAADAAPGTVAESSWRRFANNVKVWAPGISLTLRLGTEAGPPAARLAGVQGDSLQVAALPSATAVGLVPELGVLSAPDLFSSQAEADFILDHVLLDPFRALFAARGLVLLDWIDDDWTDPQTRRIYGTGVIVANQGWFERLTPHDRDVFQQAYGSAGEARADARGARAEQAPAAATAAWSEATRVAHQGIVSAAGGDGQAVYDLIDRAKRDFAASHPAPAAVEMAAPES
jgi:TRAP-type C4-dicarboxylate transport system substrate-binding protein